MSATLSSRRDRRVRYTKSAIKDALLEGLREKSFEKLSISSVCAIAQVTRTTFYAHYDNLNQVLDELILEAFEIAEHTSSTPSMSLLQRLRYLLQFDTVEALREHNGDLPPCQRIADTPKYRVLFQDRTLSEYIKGKLFRILKPTAVPEIADYCHLSLEQAERYFRYQLAGSYEVNCSLGWVKDDAWYASRLLILRMEHAGFEAIRAANT